MRNLCLVLAALIGLAGCETMKSMNPQDWMDLSFGADVEQFTFDSGGASHLEGYGAWKVSFDRNGAVRLAHTLNGQTTNYDPYALTPDQANNLWAVIDRLPFRKLSEAAEAAPQAAPGTPTYAFNWTIDGKPHTASLPSTEALKNSGVSAMVSFLEPLIEDATGVEATLK
jgi:hypothetical protein